MSQKKKGAKNVTNKMPPTLLVGLGGTGCAIVGEAYKLASEEQQKSIQFAFLDTDANELRERKHLAPQAHTVQTSRRITVGQALRDDPEAYANTFPINPQLMNKPLTEGAGQIRAVSKLAFDMCVREGRLGGLHEAINNLQMLDGDPMEQSIRVLIVSTLVGGTGSGILLPVAMYLRNYLENYCNKKPIIRAFCLLPDVFFNDPNKTEIEKSNLRTNAYATLRELDAFMLRADSKPGSEIRSRFSLKMPRPGTVDQYDDYELNPLDYCFLFDAQNINGETLMDLEDYKRHAAQCIYASSISRLHKRLNSSEDNTILERCAQSGRNRYCGVGVSTMRYPMDAVLDYVALSWMSQAMTDEWLRYDKMTEDEQARRKNSRKNGVTQPKLDERKLYCDNVYHDIFSDSKNYLGVAINEETSEIDAYGFPTGNPRWNAYLLQLNGYLRDLATDSVDDSAVSSDISVTLKKLGERDTSNFHSQFENVSSQLKTLMLKVRRQAENKAGVEADAMFSIDRYDPKSPVRLEHYLMIGDVPIHPSSARYFLYNLRSLLEEQKLMLNSNEPSVDIVIGEETISLVPFPVIEKKVAEFFTAETLPGEEGSGRRVTISDYAANLKKKGFLNTDYIEGAEKVMKLCRSQVQNIRKYYSTYMFQCVIEKALAFIDNLCKNYEEFYKKLGDEIKQIDRRIKRIEQSFPNRKGNPILNVCASPTCMQAILDACPNTIDSIQLTPEFRHKIFDAIFKNSSANTSLLTRQQRQVIDQIISKDILKFWRESVMEQYPQKIDMDIIQALVAEAEYERDLFDTEKLVDYFEEKIEQAHDLAAPFIDKPVGQPYEIVAYGMNNEIEDEDDMLKVDMIKLLGHYEKDADMKKYELHIMRALYNLKACDLKKFASADPHPADPRTDGSYFRDYVTRIDNILPDSEKSNIITPHLDRRWHFAGVLPDFEDKTETARQTQAQKMFLAALAYEFVRYDNDRYKFVGDNGDFISEEIVVADGKCDKLHEVYEALSISRPLVRSFRERYDARAESEKNEGGLANKDFTASELYTKLNNLKLRRYSFLEKVSCLEVPLLYKAAIGNGSFDDDDAITMLHNFMDMIDEYLSIFYSEPVRRTGYLVQWLEEQTDLMLKNIRNHYSSNDPKEFIMRDPINDPLVTRMMNNIIGKFEYLSSANEHAKECVKKYHGEPGELDKWKTSSVEEA